MNQVEKENILTVLSTGLGRIISDYTNNGLLLNACAVAKSRYENVDENFVRLSTTQNIPNPLRLETELDMVFDAEQLVAKYNGDVIRVICDNYVITTVSAVDAILEDLYESLYTLSNPGASQADIEKIIRNAWTNEAMLNFFCDPASLNLQRPAALNTDIREAFMRYSELRIIRHALLHTNKRLSARNLAKLQDNLDQTPNERKHFAMINAPFFDGQHYITLRVTDLLSIRKYAYTFLMYLRSAFDELPVLA